MAQLPEFGENVSRTRRPAWNGREVWEIGKRIMPLRVRLIALIGLVLLASLAGGSVLVGWHAASSVRTELRAALDVGANTIRNGLGELVRTNDRADELRHLVGTFNGNRHVRATLLDRTGSAARGVGAVRADAAGSRLVPSP